jgi:hypothetical protein
MDSRPTAKAVTDSCAGGTLRVADARGTSPSNLWRPSVRRNDRREVVIPAT